MIINIDANFRPVICGSMYEIDIDWRKTVISDSTLMISEVKF